MSHFDGSPAGPSTSRTRRLLDVSAPVSTSRRVGDPNDGAEPRTQCFGPYCRIDMVGSLLDRWALPGPIIVLLLVGAVLAYASPEYGELMGPPGLVVAMGAAAYLLHRRSRALVARERMAWRSLGAGMALIATGILTIIGMHSLGMNVPAFGAVDLFFLAGYGCFMAAFYRLARADSDGRSWILSLLDALVGAIALGTLAWVYFYRALTLDLEGVPRWETLIAAIYPLLDVAVFILLMILMLRRSNFRWDPRLVLLTFAIVFQAFADLIYMRDGLGQSFVDAEPVYWLFLVAAALLLTVAAIVDIVPPRREFPDRDLPAMALMWPYLLVLTLVAAHAYHYHSLSAEPESVVLLDALLLIGGLALIRQAIITHRHRTRLEEQRSELVASVSHELRTPLTAMVGYLALLEDGGEEFPPDARSEMISEAASQARHMARLVSDLVMLARGGNHPVPLEIVESAMSSVLTSALRGIDPESSRIEERFEDDVVVRVDSDRVRQAISNLLTNAVKYGGGSVVITGRADDSDLVVEVHDNGAGLPVRYQVSVWQRFERGSQRLSSRTPGMGIGLSIVKAVAEAHGGKAGYRRSELLGGACFWVMIPGCVSAAVQGEDGSHPVTYVPVDPGLVSGSLPGSPKP